ncbi:helix-turn-helix transcriptional regulator [Natronorarus salvus]|uniref:helix-turn-helix transcriptional regulator n=1 Tax=Natronorarus salvus TaxID=3117733 RepID=UPI002F26AE42
MERASADLLVGAASCALVLLGVIGWWTSRGTGMDGMHGGAGAAGAVYLFGGLIAAAVVVGLYAIGRDGLTEPRRDGEERQTATDGSAEDGTELTASVGEGRTDDVDRVLSVLPEDERRVLEPVLETPGLTQVELRGRSDFSKAKVSQTVSELEDRGLLYRERQGRTYRIYPGELATPRERER